MKSILVIDTPKSCFECPLMYYDCMVIKDDRKYETREDRRPDWCPLKPLPKPKDIDEVEWGDDLALGEIKGWNDCLEEIQTSQ